jgi:2-polyprenyl-3-methyl-5-hydroxy-6-metoxy-1,4-benzoquinol methylase
VKSFLITGAGRSGTTAAANFVGAFLGTEPLIEPAPAPHVESRLCLEGLLKPQWEDVRDTIGLRWELAKKAGSPAFVEKNVIYGPYLEIVAERLDAHIIFVHRNPWDVVESWLTWSDGVFGNLLRDQLPHSYLSLEARSNLFTLPLEADLNDLSVPRPRGQGPTASAWNSLSRVGKFAYYWGAVNRIHLEQIRNIRTSQVLSVSADDALGPTIHSFLNSIPDLEIQHDRLVSPDSVETNSIEERFPGTLRRHLRFNWSDAELAEFRWFTRSAAEELGYDVGKAGTRPRPASYGTIWESQVASVDWFQWMHESRHEAHATFMQWLADEPCRGWSVLEVGAGVGVFYPRFLLDECGIANYLGLDVSSRVVSSARALHQEDSRIRFEQGSVEHNPALGDFDLVFSQGTIDNVFDMPAFIDACIEHSRRFVYISFYRKNQHGNSHEYEWSADHGCFYNDAHHERVAAMLDNRHDVDWLTFPVWVSNAEVWETHYLIRRAGAGVETHNDA